MASAAHNPASASDAPLRSASGAPLRIGIDAHTVGNRRSGDESYTVGLVRGLSRIDDQNLYTLYTTSDAACEILGPLPENFCLRRVRPHQRHTRIMLSLPWLLARDRQDVAHFQYIAPPRLGASLVLTVHDVSFEFFPENFAPMERFALRWGTPLSVRRADKVITVSDFSKQQLAEVYGLPPDKIAVTHNAVDGEFSAVSSAAAEQEVRRRFGLDRDFVLWVGNFMHRKRLDVLVEAFRKLVSEGGDGVADCDLVLAGARGGIYPEVLNAVRRAGLEERVRFLGYVPAEDLPHLYRQARVFVFPSEYEGFGIPVLEAMSCGTPVICSQGSSLAEVVGDAAITVASVTAESFATALWGVLQDEARCRDLKQRGLARAKHFSWDETARSTLRAYRDAFLAYSGRVAGRRH